MGLLLFSLFLLMLSCARGADINTVNVSLCSSSPTGTVNCGVLNLPCSARISCDADLVNTTTFSVTINKCFVAADGISILVFPYNDNDMTVFNVSFFYNPYDIEPCTGSPVVPSRACHLQSGCSFDGSSFLYKNFPVSGFLLNNPPSGTPLCLDSHYPHYPDCGPHHGNLNGVLVWTTDVDTQCNQTSQQCQSIYSTTFSSNVQHFSFNLHNGVCINNTLPQISFRDAYHSFRPQFIHDGDRTFLYSLTFYDDSECRHETAAHIKGWCQQGKLCQIQWLLGTIDQLYWGIDVGDAFCSDAQFIPPYCTSTSAISSWWSQYWYIVAAAAGGGVVLIAIIITIIVCCRRRRKTSTSLPQYHLVNNVIANDEE